MNPSTTPVYAAATAAQAYFDAWNRHDVSAILAAFAPEATFWDISMDAPILVAGLGGPFHDTLTQFPDLTFVVTFLRPVGDSHAVAEWRMQGTATIDGKTHRIDVPGTDVFEVQGDKLSAARAYFNAQTMASQLAA